jgi:hypothetical protein
MNSEPVPTTQPQPLNPWSFVMPIAFGVVLGQVLTVVFVLLFAVVYTLAQPDNSAKTTFQEIKPIAR